MHTFDLKCNLYRYFEASYDVSTSIELFGAAVYPLALTMPLPVLLYLITLEKEERLRELQRSMGLKTSHHVIATGIFTLGQYLVNAFIFGATGSVVGRVVHFRLSDWLHGDHTACHQLNRVLTAE
jgi:hypothetical protein